MFAQMLYDSLAKKRPPGIRTKLINKLMLTARKAVLKAGDPLVDYTVGGTSIKIPLSHNLGLYYRNDPYYSTSLATVARTVQGKYPDLTFIDVGANVGDTIPLLRSQARFPILAIEGDPAFFKTLELNARAFEDVTNVECFLGESGRAEPGMTFVSGNGTGRLEKTADPSAQPAPAAKIRALDEVLREHARFQGAKMIKIDTDGFDAKVMRGAADWLRKAKPVVFFEYAPYYWERQGEDCVSTFKLLKDLGYSKFIVFLASGEFFCSAEMDNLSFVEELRVMHKKQYFYCDICAFAGEDLDLFTKVRQQELDANIARSRW